MIVKTIFYLSRTIYSFVANLDVIDFFAPFSCYADDFSYAFPSFKEIELMFLEEVIKVVGLTFSCLIKYVFLHVLTLITSSSLFNVSRFDTVFCKVYFLCQ